MKKSGGYKVSELYNALLFKKQQGEGLRWDNITRDELYELFKDYPDSMIAELYDISKDTVKSKRNKWGIKQYTITTDKIFKDFKL